MNSTRIVVTVLSVLAGTAGAQAGVTPAPHKVGAFMQDSDIGDVKQKGSSTFDARTDTYRVVGNGNDLWAAKDDFHFVSRKVSGDVAITATVTPVISSNEPHSKAGLMVRQDLSPDSAYADIVVHQNGLVALQYRETRGGSTHEIDTPHTGPGRFQLVRKGDYVSISIADADGKLREASGLVFVKLRAPYHVGLLVCSHSDTKTKTDDFAAVKVGRP